MSKCSISRVKRSREKAKETYDKMGKWYDFIFGWTEKKYKRMGIEKLNVGEGDIALEIGFGTGRCIIALAESVGDSGTVYGIDISESMYQITNNRVKKANLSDRVVLKRSDALNLPFDDDCFDEVFMSFALELFDTPEIPILLQECKRVLKNKGKLCVVSLSKEGNHESMQSLYEWLHIRFPNYFDCRPIYVKKSIEYAGLNVLSQEIAYILGMPVEIVLAEK